MKHHLWEKIRNVETQHEAIWFELENMKDITFGTMYIPLRDSPYFEPESFARIQEKCTNKNVILIGDLNSRLGDLNENIINEHSGSYSKNPDKIINENGRHHKNM